jgi:hypothetical protein
MSPMASGPETSFERRWRLPGARCLVRRGFRPVWKKTRSCGFRGASVAASPRGLRGSISRTMIPKFVAAISARQQHWPCQGSRNGMPHAIIQGAAHRPLAAPPGKQSSSARSRFRRCADPRRTTPATKLSRFLSKPILRPIRRNAAASSFSTSHGTCSARLLARLPGVHHR